MLSFLKSKPILKDLIPDNHVDIHSHLLPGIDDGARNFQDTLRLTKALQTFGISQLITTPHVIENVWDNSALQIKEKETTIINELGKNQITIPFRAAAEYMLDDSFVQLFQSERKSRLCLHAVRTGNVQFRRGQTTLHEGRYQSHTEVYVCDEGRL